MTVSYTAEVATCSGFGCFLKLLFRWRGSIYKLVWPDLFLFLGTYFALSVMYRFLLDGEEKAIFEKVVRYCDKNGNLIPVSFVLGFYVSIVIGRWWDQFKSIPWPDPVAVFVSAYIQGQDDKGRMMRRTIMRYCCLSLTITFTMVSPRVKKRFPTLDHLIEAGLLLENEKEIIEELNQSVPGYSKQWLPVIWACSIVTRARKEGKIRDDSAVRTILDELNKFRAGCGALTSYDWISVPLVYTQVVTLAVYSYFLACVMGRQWLEPDPNNKEESQSVYHELDLIFPIFTTLQFFFYMGWLKVAESLVNPFGDDDDDFELNWMVDRNLQVSYLIVDEMHNNHPQLLRDQYWDEVFPAELPYTVASEQYRNEPPPPSTANIVVSKDDGEIVSPPSVKSLLDMNDCESGIFMRSSKQKLSTSPEDELIFIKTCPIGVDPLSFQHRKVISKGHPQLHRAVHSAPVGVGEKARAAIIDYGVTHGSSENNIGIRAQYEEDDDRSLYTYVPTVTPPYRRRRFSGRQVSASKPGSIVGRRERRESIRSNASQSTLAESLGGRLSRTASVTSMIRRMLSRDRGEKTAEPNSPGEGSVLNIRNVAEDVIPELDENMATIVSMRAERKIPTVHSIFGTNPSPDVPTEIAVGQPDVTVVTIPSFDTAAARERFFQQESKSEGPTPISISAPEVSAQSNVALTGSDAGFHSEEKSDVVSEEAGDDPDLSMDDIQVKNRKTGAEFPHIGKLAKTLGLKDKDSVDKADVHLLSDVSRIKEDSEEDEEADKNKSDS